jgi:type I restriction enzyme S subunit
MSDLPRGWVQVPVEELAADEPASLTDGPFGSNLKTSHYTENGPRVIRLQNIGDGKFLDGSAHISEEHFEKLRRHEAVAGDVVIAMLGETLPRACAVPSYVGPAIVKADCVRLRVHPSRSTPSYITHALNSPQLRAQAADLVHGVGRPRLGLKWLRSLSVPVAPRLEQDRIADAIESYFTRLDDAVATLERVQRNLKRYRASVLKAAVEGRLVPTEAELARAEGRDYEPASVLLERILTERRRRWEEAELAKMKAKGKGPKDDKWKAKYKDPAAPDAVGLPELPEGWCWSSVEQLGFIASGQTPKGVTSAGAAEGDIPWFRVGDMNTAANHVRMTIAKEWLTQDQVVALGLHVRPSGTILFPKRGGAIGTNKKRILGRPSTYDLNTMGIVPVGSIGAFLWTWFLGVDLGSLADGSNVPQINHGDIAPLPVPLAPAHEQIRIVNEVNAVLSIADDAASVVSANRARVGRLRQSILKWAFEGRLVDQDPTDEPASRLLERIEVEREAVRTGGRVSARRRRKETTA